MMVSDFIFSSLLFCVYFSQIICVKAHDQAIRSMVWSHNDNWMVSGDDGGAIK